MATLTVELKDDVFEDFKKQCKVGASPELVAQYVIANYTYGLEMVFSSEELEIMNDAIRTAGWTVMQTFDGDKLPVEVVHNLTYLGMIADKCSVYALAAKGRENESK